MKLLIITAAIAAFFWLRWEMKHSATDGSWVDDVQRYLDEVSAP